MAWPQGVMPAFVVDAPRSGSWQAVSIPDARSNTAVVRVRAVGLCGTDAHLWTGESPNIQRGLTTYPWRPGHEWAGEIVAVEDEGGLVDWLTPGTTVVGDPFVNCGRCATCRAGGRSAHCPHRVELGVRGDAAGALAEYLAVPIANLTPVPVGVSPAAATLAEPATTALHAWQAADLQPGGRACVIGTGTLGLIAIQVAVHAGADVIAIGVDDAGMELAARAGARVFRPGEAPGDSCSAVVEASGAQPSLLEASRVVGVGGAIGLLGFPAAPTVPVDAAGLILAGAGIRAVLGGIDRMADALQLISVGIIDPDLIIDAVRPAAEAAECFDELLEPRLRPKLIVEIDDGINSVVEEKN